MLGRLGDVPLVDLADESFVVADPAVLGRVVADPAAWRRWWPDLVLRPHEERGAQGVRWVVSGSLVGTAEVWLEPVRDGAVAHFFLKADPAEDGVALRGLRRRRLAVARRRELEVRLAWKAAVREMKRELEADREVGTPRTG